MSDKCKKIPKRDKKNRARSNGSLFFLNNLVTLIGGGEKDVNQVVTFNKGFPNQLETTDFTELLKNANPNPRYISIVSEEEPKNRPDKEDFICGDLWYKPSEKTQYTITEEGWVKTGGPPGLDTSVVITTETQIITMTFTNGVLTNVATEAVAPPPPPQTYKAVSSIITITAFFYMSDHHDDYEFERGYWGNCCNTFDEEQKHYIYAKYMGIQRSHYSFILPENSRILDIGGGPCSMLLKTKNLEYGLVVDPIQYPHWTMLRYGEMNIAYDVKPGEEVDKTGFDEVWIYNCMQHAIDPAKIIENAKRAAPRLRIFEWVDIPAHDGHPHMLTEEALNSWIGQKGKVAVLGEWEIGRAHV